MEKVPLRDIQNLKTVCEHITRIVIAVVGTVLLFFYERYFKCKKQKQKYLSNIQPNISINKKKHLSNIHSDKIHTKKTQVNMC